jgi:hypothetical protein
MISSNPKKFQKFGGSSSKSLKKISLNSLEISKFNNSNMIFQTMLGKLKEAKDWMVTVTSISYDISYKVLQSRKSLLLGELAVSNDI